MGVRRDNDGCNHLRKTGNILEIITNNFWTRTGYDWNYTIWCWYCGLRTCDIEIWAYKFAKQWTNATQFSGATFDVAMCFCFILATEIYSHNYHKIFGGFCWTESQPNFTFTLLLHEIRFACKANKNIIMWYVNYSVESESTKILITSEQRKSRERTNEEKKATNVRLEYRSAYFLLHAFFFSSTSSSSAAAGCVYVNSY